jgi:hypothetical protein
LNSGVGGEGGGLTLGCKFEKKNFGSMISRGRCFMVCAGFKILKTLDWKKKEKDRVTVNAEQHLSRDRVVNYLG